MRCVRGGWTASLETLGDVRVVPRRASHCVRVRPSIHQGRLSGRLAGKVSEDAGRGPARDPRGSLAGGRPRSSPAIGEYPKTARLHIDEGPIDGRMPSVQSRDARDPGRRRAVAASRISRLFRSSPAEAMDDRLESTARSIPGAHRQRTRHWLRQRAFDLVRSNARVLGGLVSRQPGARMGSADRDAEAGRRPSAVRL